MFKFSIRELFLLTLVVGLAIGWCLDHRRMETRNRDSKVAMRELGLAMEAHGFQFNVDTETGQTSWSFAHLPSRPNAHHVLAGRKISRESLALGVQRVTGSLLF